MTEVADCETCLDGTVMSDTCDECDTRHCWKCDPCEDDEGETILGEAAEALGLCGECGSLSPWRCGCNDEDEE